MIDLWCLPELLSVAQLLRRYLIFDLRLRRWPLYLSSIIRCTIGHSIDSQVRHQGLLTYRYLLRNIVPDRDVIRAPKIPIDSGSGILFWHRNGLSLRRIGRHHTPVVR